MLSIRSTLIAPPSTPRKAGPALLRHMGKDFGEVASDDAHCTGELDSAEPPFSLLVPTCLEVLETEMVKDVRARKGLGTEDVR